MAISATMVKELRERTGSGMMECKKALVETNGDIEAAIEMMRKSGQAKAAKKAGRTAAEGLIVIKHSDDGKRAVMVEVNCETDFVARSDDFRKLAHELALQIAAAAPQYVQEDEIPADVLEHEMEIARARAKEEGKPETVLDKIVTGRIEKFKDEVVLLRQAYIRDEDLNIEKLVLQAVGKTGENIVVSRFQRWELGENTDK